MRTLGDADLPPEMHNWLLLEFVKIENVPIRGWAPNDH